MLSGLRISNFAVIEEVEVAFGEGLTAITGETGAGKSMVVDALGLLLGARADPGVVRQGCDEARVEAVLTRTKELGERLAALGLPDLGEEVSVRRVVHRSGRGKAHVNGALVTVGVLAELMRGRIQLAGQHDSLRLLEPSFQRRLLDGFGGHPEVLEGYRTAHGRLEAVDGEIASLGGDAREVASRMELLRFQLEELQRLAPLPDEDLRLDEERKRLSAVERLRRSAQEASVLLDDEEAKVSDRLGRALRWVKEAAEIDARLALAAQALERAASELDDGMRALGDYLETLEADPARLAEVEERLAQLKSLCRKHASPLNEVISAQERLAEELERLEGRGERVEALRAERARVQTEAERAAGRLTEARRVAAGRLEGRVGESLAALSLPGARFEVSVEPSGKLGPEGWDLVELRFGANPGEAIRPLSKAVSGGEASRLLLALERELAGASGCDCFVFDEVDAGVSGAVADQVGRMIQEVASRGQVICITHLPQVAAHADGHLRIHKRCVGERTCSEVLPLREKDARTRELARMLSGAKVTAEAVGAAKALVRSARRRTRLKVAS